MTTIKRYTDISQSRKLAEILPIESADMYYSDVPIRELVDKNDTSNCPHVVFKSQIFPIENLCDILHIYDNEENIYDIDWLFIDNQICIKLKQF